MTEERIHIQLWVNHSTDSSEFLTSYKDSSTTVEVPTIDLRMSRSPEGLVVDALEKIILWLMEQGVSQRASYEAASGVLPKVAHHFFPELEPVTIRMREQKLLDDSIDDSAIRSPLPEARLRASLADRLWEVMKRMIRRERLRDEE